MPDTKATVTKSGPPNLNITPPVEVQLSTSAGIGISTLVGKAVAAKDEAVSAKDDAVTASNESKSARDESVSAQAKSEAAQQASGQARDESVSAQAKSEAAQQASEQARDESVTAKNEGEAAQTKSEAAAELSEKWSSNPKGVEVEPGKYSAHHWAELAKQFANELFSSGGLFTPSSQNEYPDVSAVTKDTIWLINFPNKGDTYTYTSGTLSGETASSGFMLFYDVPQNLWTLIKTSISGVLTVNGETGPDVTLDASDVGALPEDGKAANSKKFADLEVSAFMRAGDTTQAGSDADTMVTAGVYRLYGKIRGVPEGYDWGQLTVLRGTGDTATQIISNFQGNKIAFRSGNPTVIGGAGKWQTWKGFFHDANPPTANDVKAVPQRQREVRLFAHRGGMRDVCEATPAAWQNSIEAGAYGLSTELGCSSDGVWFVYHGSSLSRLTNGTGNIYDHPASYIEGLTFNALAGTRYESTVKIPRLDDLIHFIEKTGTVITCEIANARPTSVDADKRAAITKFANSSAKSNVYLEVTADADAARIRSITTDTYISWSFANSWSKPEELDGVAAYGNMVIRVPSDWLTSPVRDAAITKARRLGLDIFCYTTGNDAEDLEKVLASGIYNVITDRGWK